MSDCKGCSMKILESGYSYKKEGLIFCLDCSFKNNLIKEKEYLDNIPLSLVGLRAVVIKGEINLWQKKKESFGTRK